MSERVNCTAIRVLVVVVASLAFAIAMLALRPGSVASSWGGTVVRSAGGGFVAAAALAAAIPGLFAWHEHRPGLLWLWTAVALVASVVMIAFLDDVHPPGAHIVLWPARCVEIGVWVLAALSTLGSYLAGFAIQASEARYNGEAPELAARLRGLIVGVVALAVVLFGIGLLSGQRAYSDTSFCGGSLLGTLIDTEGRRTRCFPSYTWLRDTWIAGGVQLAGYLLVVLPPAWPLYRDPREQRAWWWFAWSFVAGLVAAWLISYLEFNPYEHSHLEILWPTRVVEAGVVAIQVALLVGLPLAIARSCAPRIPRARVVARPPS